MGGEIDLLAETVLLMRWYRLVYAIILPAVYQIIMSVFVFVCVCVCVCEWVKVDGT